MSLSEPLSGTNVYTDQMCDVGEESVVCVSVYMHIHMCVIVTFVWAPPSSHLHLYTCIYMYDDTCIGYTLGSQCILGIYPRWLLITPEGVISNHRGDFPVYTATQGISNL